MRRILVMAAVALMFGCGGCGDATEPETRPDYAPQFEGEHDLEVMCNRDLNDYHVIEYDEGVVYEDFARGRCPDDTRCNTGRSINRHYCVPIDKT